MIKECQINLRSCKRLETSKLSRVKLVAGEFLLLLQSHQLFNDFRVIKSRNDALPVDAIFLSNSVSVFWTV